MQTQLTDSTRTDRSARRWRWRRRAGSRRATAFRPGPSFNPWTAPLRDYPVARR
jgi:hypothetical protein